MRVSGVVRLSLSSICTQSVPADLGFLASMGTCRAEECFLEATSMPLFGVAAPNLGLTFIPLTQLGHSSLAWMTDYKAELLLSVANEHFCGVELQQRGLIYILLSHVSHRSPLFALAFRLARSTSIP
jgi:hypothetical protein